MQLSKLKLTFFLSLTVPTSLPSFKNFQSSSTQKDELISEREEIGGSARFRIVIFIVEWRDTNNRYTVKHEIFLSGVRFSGDEHTASEGEAEQGEEK